MCRLLIAMGPASGSVKAGLQPGRPKGLRERADAGCSGHAGAARPAPTAIRCCTARCAKAEAHKALTSGALDAKQNPRILLYDIVFVWIFLS
jgi:hypothetical protein